MNTTETPLEERIRTFADSVRAHLDDLPADEVDDIIIGLTADLADQAADSEGSLDLGDPATYAAELRDAAGLPDRSTAPKRTPLRTRLTAWISRLPERVRRNAFGAWALDLLVALRPVWWVLRGFGLFALTALLLGLTGSSHGDWFVPDNLVEWIVLLGIVLVSVQWGRGRWLPQNALRHARTVVSILAVILLPVALGSLLTPRVEYVDGSPFLQPGLLLDGVQVGNIFAYDENGELIESVQLYTDKGTPLDLVGGDVGDIPEGGWFGFVYNDEGRVRVPFSDARGSDVWNIYPLRTGLVDLSTGKLRASTVKDEVPPFLRAPGLLTPAPTPSAAPTDAPADDSEQAPTP